MAARSFADDIRGRDDDALRALVTSRRDLASPAPADLTSLAARAATASSIRLALGGLDEPHLQLLEALVVLGSGSADELAAATGTTPAWTTALLADLERAALVWRTSTGLRPVRAAAEVLPEPAGLAPASEAPLARREIDRLLADVDAPGRTVLDALAWGPPTGSLPGEDSATGVAARALLRSGLLHRLDGEYVRLPREVALVLREGVIRRGLRVDPPLPRPDGEDDVVDAAGADAAGGDRALALVSLAGEVLDTWDAQPPRVLRTGGLALRDLAALAGLLGLRTEETEVLLETMHAADLLAVDDARTGRDDDPLWRPTGTADAWRRLSIPERWVALAGAWLTTPASVALARARAEGRSASTGRSERVNVLAPASQGSDHRAGRLATLRALADLPAGHAPDAAALEDLVRWRHPRLGGRIGPTETATIRAQAESLGLTGRHAPTSALRALVAGDEQAARDAVSTHVPEAVEDLLIQGDLTAIAPGPLTARAEAEVRLLADVESRGTASVHRFSGASLRRALDQGWSAETVLATLRRLSRTGVPQPLEYLVRDTARSHGSIRVGGAAAFVRSDDVALLDALEADPALGVLQARRVADTVLITPVPAPAVTDLLRERGHAALTEGRDGSVGTSASAPRARPAPRPATRIRTLSQDDIAALVVRLRDGEAGRSAGRRPGSDAGRDGDPDTERPVEVPQLDSASSLALLRDAVALGEPVWIGHSDADGDIRRALLRPIRIEGGRVHGVIGDPGTSAQVPLHRITGVEPVR